MWLTVMFQRLEGQSFLWFPWQIRNRLTLILFQHHVLHGLIMLRWCLQWLSSGHPPFPPTLEIVVSWGTVFIWYYHSKIKNIQRHRYCRDFIKGIVHQKNHSSKYLFFHRSHRNTKFNMFCVNYPFKHLVSVFVFLKSPRFVQNLK